MDIAIKNSREALYLVTIAQEKSLTRAAEKLYISQPSLSYFLLDYEKRLGCKLFLRTQGGLELTAPGRCVVDASIKVLEIYTEMSNQLHSMLNKDSYVFAIPSFRGRFILPSMLSAINATHPNLNINIVEMLSKDMPDAFCRGNIQSAFFVGSRPSIPHVSFIELKNEEIFLLIPDSVKYRKMIRTNGQRNWIELSDFSDESFVLLPNEHKLRLLADAVFVEHKIAPKKTIITKDITTSFEMVAAGNGVTFVPDMFLTDNTLGIPVSIGESGKWWELNFAHNCTASQSIHKIVLSVVKNIV